MERQTVWANFSWGHWYFKSSLKGAEVWHQPNKDLLLEVPCRKGVPSSVSLMEFLKDYVERDHLPLLLVQLQQWDAGLGGLKASAIEKIEMLLRED